MEGPQLRRKNLQPLAERVISLTRSRDRRAEDLWVEERCRLFREANGLRSRGDGDELLAQRIQALQSEESPSPDPSSGAEEAGGRFSAVTVRYWRTGRHYPKNRASCEAFGQALGLGEADRHYLMTAWADRPDRCFRPADAGDPVREARHALLRKLQQEFLDKQRPEELLAMCAPGTRPQENLRYIYCRQAIQYLGSHVRRGMSELRAHVDTRSYEPQFTREMALAGEVSRSAMIRHLLILGIPFVSRQRMQDWLALLGYMPLRRDHRLPGGAAMDLFVLDLLDEYERACTGRDPVWCTEWFRQASSLLDDALEEAGCTAASPFRFKFILGGKGCVT